MGLLGIELRSSVRESVHLTAELSLQPSVCVCFYKGLKSISQPPTE